jgi:3-oxoacyl-[acyl-carrier protein] reductase
MKKLEKKVAIVTGGSRGIGKAIAQILASEGAKVIIVDRSNAEDVVDVIKLIQNDGGIASFIRTDVTKVDEVEEMIKKIIKDFDRIDILINNAGINRDAFLVEMDIKDWMDVIDTNINGVFYCTKTVARAMILQRSGKIINISSIVGDIGIYGQCNYTASKAAVNGFTRAASVELAPFGIQVNAVAPGMINTKMTEKLRKSKIGTKIFSQIPMERFGDPEEVARVVLFLASDDSSYITGEIIHVTGGFGSGIGARL